MAADEDFCSFGLRVADVAFNFLDGSIVNKRALVGSGFETGSGLERFDGGGEFRGENVVDAVLNKDAVGADQVWPELRYLEAMAPSTAASRSASSKTMKGALPPSSRESFLTVPAHWAMRTLPISVEPVNESLRTMGLEVSSAPISFAEPVTIFRTPLGTPARSASSARANAENGV